MYLYQSPIIHKCFEVVTIFSNPWHNLKHVQFDPKCKNARHTKYCFDLSLKSEVDGRVGISFHNNKKENMLQNVSNILMGLI